MKADFPIRVFLFSLFCATLLRAADNPSATAGHRNIYIDHSGKQSSTNGLGYWIWAPETRDKQTVQLWKTFEVPRASPAIHAELRIAADNAFKVWIDGKEIGSGSDWRTLSDYDLDGTLDPGMHVLAVEGFNDADRAGIIAGLHLTLADGESVQVRSDKSWRVVPNGTRGWQTTTRPEEEWESAAFVANIGQVTWWDVPVTLIHVQESLPEPASFLQSRAFQFILLTACVVCAAICLYLLIQLVSQSKAHSLVQIERDRIARDIHDDLGSNITQLLLTCEMARIKPSPEPEKNALIGQMCEGTRDILATIDEVVWIVNSQHDTLDEFSIYVCKYAQHFLSTSSMRCRLDVAHELPHQVLSQLIRRNLFLALKEALNNAVKHSRATELAVRIQLENSTLQVIVEDNGEGFDSSRPNPERHGLANMQLRMKEIGGACEVVSRPGEGCRVCFNVALKRARFSRLLFPFTRRDRSASTTDGNKPGKPLPEQAPDFDGAIQ